MVYVQNVEKLELGAQGLKRCTKCSVVKELSKFRSHPKGYLGKTAQCGQCINERDRPRKLALSRAKGALPREEYLRQASEAALPIEERRKRRREAVRRSYQKHIEKRRADGRAYKASIDQTCSVEGCATVAGSRAEGSMCSMHQWRLKEWGTTDDSGGTGVATGPDSPHWGGDSVAYKSAHHRIYRTRGKASEHLCVDCGQQADDWSYRGGSDKELTGLSQDGRYVLAYSPDPADYDPRCKADHIRYDANRSREAVAA